MTKTELCPISENSKQPHPKKKLANDDDISENTAAVKALPSQQDDSSENTAAVKALPSQQDDNSEAKFTEHILACQKAMTNGDFNEAQLYCDLPRDISPNDPRYLALNEQLRKEIDSQNALSDVLKNLSNGECRNAVNALDNIQKGTFAYTTMLEKDYKTKARECFEKAPTPTQNSNETNKGKCDTQTISKEKHLPKWNIEIIDSSVIASMLKDAEKNHLPFLKINASDDLKQKLENYINKDPSKLNQNSQNAFTCDPGNYIRTSSNIGIQLVYCNDSEMSVVFLNLVSPGDNKARVYTAKTFDHLFEEAPAIDKTEETVINGERGAYVAVKYETFSDGTGTDHTETDIAHYLFLGDKLRYLTDWNAFHIEESNSYNDDGTKDYSCDAKATVLRLESTGAKHVMATSSDNAPTTAPAPTPTPSPAPAQNDPAPQAKSLASTIMRYAEHEISLEEGKTVEQFFSIKKGLKPCLKSPKKCSKTIAPLVDESYVKFNRGVIAAILLQNNNTFNKDLFKEVQKTLLIPMNDSSERMRIANKSPVGREIMGANTLSNEDKINIFAIWYLRQFPYAGENIWNNTPSTRRSWKDYLEMADLYLDAI